MLGHLVVVGLLLLMSPHHYYFIRVVVDHMQAVTNSLLEGLGGGEVAGVVVLETELLLRGRGVR